MQKDKRDPDFYDENSLSIDETTDVKALHDEEEWRERKIDNARRNEESS